MLVPPLNFGIVEENLYRCSKLETLNLSFIENLNLKIVVFIMSEDPGRPFKEFMKSRKIEWLVINPSSHLVTSSKDEKYNDVNSSDSSIEITPQLQEIMTTLRRMKYSTLNQINTLITKTIS